MSGPGWRTLLDCRYTVSHAWQSHFRSSARRLAAHRSAKANITGDDEARTPHSSTSQCDLSVSGCLCDATGAAVVAAAAAVAETRQLVYLSVERAELPWRVFDATSRSSVGLRRTASLISGGTVDQSRIRVRVRAQQESRNNLEQPNRWPGASKKVLCGGG